MVNLKIVTFDSEGNRKETEFSNNDSTIFKFEYDEKPVIDIAMPISSLWRLMDRKSLDIAREIYRKDNPDKANERLP